MSDLEGARGLLTPVVPFAISGNPSHLGPSHLVKQYLASLFGNGRAATTFAGYARKDFPSGLRERRNPRGSGKTSHLEIPSDGP